MKIKLLAFGITKDILGSRQVSYELPEPATVGHLLQDLEQKYPRLQGLASLKVAVNSDYAGPDVSISPADEVVLIPPVSGG